MVYRLWDTDIGRLFGAFDSESEALTLVMMLVDTYGSNYAEVLALGCERDDNWFTEVLTGAALVVRSKRIFARREEHVARLGMITGPDLFKPAPTGSSVADGLLVPVWLTVSLFRTDTGTEKRRPTRCQEDDWDIDMNYDAAYDSAMPERSSKSYRPRGPKQIVDSVLDVATFDDQEALEVNQDAPELGKNPHAAALGRLGGKKGGPARALSLSAERRREIARKAAQARWERVNDVDGSRT